MNWISHQLFRDCVKVKILNDDVVSLDYAPGHTEIVDSQFFYDLDDVIETALFDWWLSDVDFSLDDEESRERRDVVEDGIAWNQIEFCETWHDVDCDRVFEELFLRRNFDYMIRRRSYWLSMRRRGRI